LGRVTNNSFHLFAPQLWWQKVAQPWWLEPFLLQLRRQKKQLLTSFWLNVTYLQTKMMVSKQLFQMLKAKSESLLGYVLVETKFGF
jgi:hypothetical protein